MRGSTSSIGEIVTGAWRAGDDRLVRLVPRNTPPSARLHKSLVREPGMVPANVRDTFKSCCAAESPWPLLVWGDVGTGKTRFGLIVNDFYSGSFMDFADLMAEYAALRRSELDSEDSVVVLTPNVRKVRETEWIESLAGPRVFVVDDIARRGDTQSETSRELLSRFLDRREGMPTVLISNLGPMDLATAYDDRVGSRMCCGSVVKVAGADMRIGG